MVASVDFPADEAGRAELLFCIAWEFLRLHGASAEHAGLVQTFLEPRRQGATSAADVVECVELAPADTGLGLRHPSEDASSVLRLEECRSQPIP